MLPAEPWGAEGGRRASRSLSCFAQRTTLSERTRQRLIIPLASEDVRKQGHRACTAQPEVETWQMGRSDPETIGP